VTAGARTPAGGRAVALARMAARSTPGAGVLECVLSMAAGGEWRGRPARGDRATGSRRPGGRRNGAARRLWWARQRRGLARRAGQRLAPMAARLAASAPAWRRPGAAAGAQSVARGRAGKPTPPTRSGMMRRAPRRTMRRWAAWTAMAATALLMAACAGPQADSRRAELPSWNDGPARQAIVQFVRAVTERDSRDFVPPQERIAVFDNDGTLWSEQPMYFQALFALDRIRAMAPGHPEWARQQPFKAAIEGDRAALAKAGDAGLLKIVGVTHTGMSADEFTRS